MRISLLIVIIFSFHNTSLSQGSFTTNYFQQNNQLLIEQIASFSFGSPGNCPSVVWYQIDKTADSITVNILYDLTGAWPTFFCTTKDTLIYNYTGISSGNYVISAITNGIVNGSSPSNHDTLALDTNYSNLIVSSLPSSYFELNKGRSFEAYPNPTKDRVTITYELPEDMHNAVIEIFDATGSRVLVNISVSISEGTKQLSLNQLSAGSYICLLKSRQGQILASRRLQVVK